MKVEIVNEIDPYHKIIKYTFENVSDDVDPDQADLDPSFNVDEPV